MLLFIYLNEIIGGGWDGSGKEAWVFFEGRIGGGSWFPDTCVRWSDIEDCVSFLEIPEILKKLKKE